MDVKIKIMSHKTFIPVLFVFLMFFNALSQTTKEEISNAEIFSAQSGTLIEKEFIDIGSIGQTFVKIIKITDMISGESVSSIRIQKEVKGSYSSDTKIAHLDSDEIDGLIKSMIIIKENVFGIASENYTEITFRSRSGFETGCYWSKNQWKPYIQIEKRDRESLIRLKKDDFDNFLDLIKQANGKI